MNSEFDYFKGSCENSFVFYCQQALKILEPETEFEWNWHLTELCLACERVYYGEIRELDINIPPRMLKTVIVSILFPSWLWIKNPSLKIIGASSAFDLSTKINIKRRELIESPFYQELWPVELKDYLNTTEHFENVYNGFMKSVSVGGKITGQGGDVIITDDLIDAKDAHNKHVLKNTSDWYKDVLYSRVQNAKKAMRININQRLNKQDISGFIRENYPNFKRLVLQMEKTDKNYSTVVIDDPRSVGEFLHPNRYSEPEKEQAYKAMGFYGWSAQMQQIPAPVGGGLIKEEWLRWYDTPPAVFVKKIIAGDLTFKGNEDSDYVCFQCWGLTGDGNKYLLDIIRGQWSYKITKDMFEAFCAKNLVERKIIEDKANGPALISDFAGKIHGVVAWPDKNHPEYKKLDKVQRVHLVSQEYELGYVYLPRHIECALEFKDELLGFTEKGSSTGNDDMVDTSTMALIDLKDTEAFSYSG